eukprot:g9941.t1
MEQLKSDCDVDVFMYISVEDEVPLRYQTGHFEDALFFTPHTPQYPEVDLAVGVLNPVSVEFHQEQAGFIPNTCEKGCESNAFWQLYKMKAVYRMMQEHETATKRPYTWIIRSRLDIAWMLPLQPLSRFSPSRVYAGHNFFPLADQFLLVPRRFAPTLFEAVRLCYDCGALQAQSKSGIPAQTESLLRMVLRGEDGSHDVVPFGYYEFPVVMVRNNEGGVCEVLHPHKLSCEMLRVSGNTAGPEDGGDDELANFRCMAVMRRWYQQACVEMFPPADDNSSGKELGPVAVERDDVGDDGEDAGVTGRTFNGIGRIDAQRQRKTIAGRDHRRQPGRTGEAIMTFEEATGRVEGIHRDLRDLLALMRVEAAPTHERRDYFLAHHYPFHRLNPLRRAERGPLDQVAVIEGYRLSEADFNRLVLAFSCFLSGAVERGHEARGTASAPPRGQEGGVQAPEGGDEEGILVLKTTAAEAEGLQALVNCSLVEPLHDVWMGLLENKFEPSETVCHGPVEPCLERALAGNRDYS